jgi:hypothetical protein
VWGFASQTVLARDQKCNAQVWKHGICENAGEFDIQKCNASAEREQGSSHSQSERQTPTPAVYIQSFVCVYKDKLWFLHEKIDSAEDVVEIYLEHPI